MPVSRADVERVAELARLSLSREETGRMALELAAILAYAEAFRALPLAEVAPAAELGELASALRADAPAPGLTRDEALYNAPACDEGLFVVPRILRER